MNRGRQPVNLVAQNGAVALLAFLLVLLVWRATHASGGLAGRVGGGKTPPAPEFSLDRLSGPGVVDLATYSGRVVVVNFWASWCGPCKQEAPTFEAAWRSWKEHLVTFIGINVDDFASDARAFSKRYKLSYPMAHDGSGKTEQLYGVGPLPQTFILSPQGEVVDQLVGYAARDELDGAIAHALHDAGAD